MSGRDDPWLAIILAVVDAVEGSAAEHFSRISEVQASLFQSAVALLRIESDLHPTICVPPEMSSVKLPRRGDGGEFAEGSPDPQVALRSPGPPRRTGLAAALLILSFARHASATK